MQWLILSQLFQVDIVKVLPLAELVLTLASLWPMHAVVILGLQAQKYRFDLVNAWTEGLIEVSQRQELIVLVSVILVSEFKHEVIDHSLL